MDRGPTRAEGEGVVHGHEPAKWSWWPKGFPYVSIGQDEEFACWFRDVSGQPLTCWWFAQPYPVLKKLLVRLCTRKLVLL